MAIISRRQYDHPALATAGGSALHASITNLYTVLGDDSMSRYKTFTAVANSSVGVIAHEFGLDFANLKVQIFTGTYPALTLVSDPVGSGWTVAATSGLASRSIDVTAPASGGPHTYAVVVTHESNGSQYIPGLVSIGTQSFAGAKTFLTSTSTPISAVTNYSLYSEVSAPATPLSGVAIYAKTDKKLYRKGTDGVEAEIGSGSASGFINYILNADLEAGNTTGWATYKDAAASTPVDGTGGSPTTLTVTANSTTPLRGNFDLKIAKTAANSQGEGFSYAFTIKSPDISKKLQVSFDLNTSDANYTSSDVVIYIYDVTNSTLITPSVTAIPKIGASTYSLTFDTTTSLSYRLIFHWATTNATASNIYFENFFVGPGSLVQGAAIGADVAYTPVLPITNATLTGRYNRIGSKARLHIQFAFTGTPSAASFSFTAAELMAGTGLTLDTSLPASTDTIENGSWHGIDTGTANFAGNVSVQNSGLALWDDQNTGNLTTTSAWPIANTDFLSVTVTVPIAQWAGNATANLGINPIQYLGNSNTSTSVSDTSAFTYGPAGNSIVAVSSTGVWVKKRVQLLQGNWSASGGTPIVKVSADGLLWLNAQDVFPPLKSAGLFYGIDIQVSGVNTVDVAFGGDGASTGAAWSTVTSYKWRVDVAVPGQAVGFGIADTNASGLIPSGVYNNTTQAWTIGGSGATATNTIQSNMITPLTINRTTAGSQSIAVNQNGTAQFRIGYDYIAGDTITGTDANDMVIRNMITTGGFVFAGGSSNLILLRATAAGACTLGGSTSGLHTLQGAQAADYQVKITNAAANGSGLRIQCDNTISTCQSWFSSATNIGSLTTAGAFSLPTSGVTHSIIGRIEQGNGAWPTTSIGASSSRVCFTDNTSGVIIGFYKAATVAANNEYGLFLGSSASNAGVDLAGGAVKGGKVNSTNGDGTGYLKFDTTNSGGGFTNRGGIIDGGWTIGAASFAGSHTVNGTLVVNAANAYVTNQAQIVGAPSTTSVANGGTIEYGLGTNSGGIVFVEDTSGQEPMAVYFFNRTGSTALIASNASFGSNWTVSNPTNGFIRFTNASGGTLSIKGFVIGMT